MSSELHQKNTQLLTAMVDWLASGETGSILEIERRPRQARIGTKKSSGTRQDLTDQHGLRAWGRAVLVVQRGGSPSHVPACDRGMRQRPPQGAAVYRTRQPLVLCVPPCGGGVSRLLPPPSQCIFSALGVLGLACRARAGSPAGSACFHPPSSCSYLRAEVARC